jgi:hypothetical protein
MMAWVGSCSAIASALEGSHLPRALAATARSAYTAANLPAELAVGRRNATAARLGTNRAMSCNQCIGQQASLPVPEIPSEYHY